MLNFPDIFWKSTEIKIFKKIHPVWRRVVQCGRTDGRTDR